jgi:enoyl-CoA hydratase/carnithine racemase
MQSANINGIAFDHDYTPTLQNVPPIRAMGLRLHNHGNRITQATAEELIAGLDSARRNPAILGCMLTDHGDLFCLRGDLSAREAAHIRHDAKARAPSLPRLWWRSVAFDLRGLNR